MRKLALIAALLCASFSFAQQGINYKALIKDANNAVVSNQSITVQFTILQGVAQTNVYQETHTPTTDANGIIIINIGEGTVVSGVFDEIDWASDEHFLNTQIDTGSGLVDLGTTSFTSVPYALSAKTAANVTGLEQIDEGSGNGLVKVGRDATTFGTIGSNAVDLSFSEELSSVHGATGTGATAMGYNTQAPGYFSTALGLRTRAGSWASVALGTYNVGLGTANGFVGSDPVFEVGVGTSDANRRNAFTVMRNSRVGVNTADPSQTLDVVGVSELNGNVHILNGGRLGIGTSSPSQPLDVVGRSELNGHVHILNGGWLGIGTSSPSQPLDVVGRSELNGNVHILNGGRLGIGTSNPSDALVIENGRLEIRGFSNATGSPGTGTIEIGDNLRFSSGRIVTNSNTALLLQNGNNGDLNVDSSTLFVDASTNRVGIGTATPSQKLDVLGNAEINGNVIASGQVYGERVAFTGFQDTVISLTGFSLGNYFPTFSDVSDVFNSMTSGSGVFTAPRTGLYFFNTSISFSNGDGADDTMWLGFSVNNSTTMSTEIRINPRVDTSPGREQSYSHAAVIQLNQNQTLRVMVRSVNPATTIQILERTFTGYYLGDL